MMKTRIEHPENNKVVLERNGKVANLLSVSEANILTGRIKQAGIKIQSAYIDWFSTAVVREFKIGNNVYRVYPLS